MSWDSEKTDLTKRNEELLAKVVVFEKALEELREEVKSSKE